MANTFRKIYKKTGSSGTSSDYQLVGNVGVDGVELDIMKGSSSSAAGEIGLVPKPAAGSSNRYLRCDGTWAVPPDTNTTYKLSDFGITATATEINKLHGLTTSAVELGRVDGVTSNIQTQINSIKYLLNGDGVTQAHNGLVAYSATEVINTNQGLTWNFYPGIGYRPRVCIFYPEASIGDAYLYYKFDASDSSKVVMSIYGNVLKGLIRIGILIPAG